MFRPAKFPVKSELQMLSLHISKVLIQTLGSETYFTAETPEAQAALPDSQKTAMTIVIRKSFRKRKWKSIFPRVLLKFKYHKRDGLVSFIGIAK